VNRPAPTHRPVSSYRLQLHGNFGFVHARETVPYLSQLGITDCYTSPHFKANPGSTHGYDICDHSSLNPELGTEGDYDAFCGTLRGHALGHIADIVPNHMAADPRSNPWWRDVLENGPSSPFASFFDIDWHPVKAELFSKVLLPVLGDQYGRVLERGELQLRYCDGALHLHYFDHVFPINPRQSPRVLGLHVDELEAELPRDPALREYLSILTALQNLPAYTERDAARIAERQREKEVARERLARLTRESAAIERHIDRVVANVNGTPGVPASFDRLHDLLEHQAYRLAYWRTASDEINYRRFFDINELVALRMEREEVFDASHGLLKRLIEEGKVTGVRVDHPDGLFDPSAYFARLQQLAGVPVYVAAEKILSQGEVLPEEWQVSGTTGYNFLNVVGGLFVDGSQLRRLGRIYKLMTGLGDSFQEVAYRSRLTVMLTSMASELNVLSHALNRLSETDRTTRDFTLSNCRRVLREVVACFPVYRTYVSARGASAFDRDVIDAALTEARLRNPVMERSIFDFLRDVLLSPLDSDPQQPDHAARLRFAMQMQQFTAPVLAKGVEDTAFYRYHVLISANDVGGNPSRPSVPPQTFHTANQQRLRDWPLELLTTSTHDTKRGEDARTRISVLSEMPEAWGKNVVAWMRMNIRNRTKVRDVSWPSRNDEYLFYQALVGAWPPELTTEPLPERAPAALVERLVAYMAKATREAKVHTSWIHQNEEYGRAVQNFVTATLTGRTARRFLASFIPVQRRIAHAGMLNSISQVVLKLTSPGVPDFYQGTELWDLSLVDPDNRRPVDFSARRALLAGLQPLVSRLDAGETAGEEVEQLFDEWTDGRIKLFVTTRGLHFRRSHAELFLSGGYQPLSVEGPGAEHVVAFARHDESGTLLTVVPRLVLSLTLDDRSLPRGRHAWKGTNLALPESASGRAYRHLFTGEMLQAESSLPLADVLRTSPVAVMWSPAATA
jgi:(1->4)-alpha-D-glucan 1-alpha-D-glucosylmutase